MKNKRDEQGALLNTKLILRNMIFIVTTLILLPIANLCQTFIIEKLLHVQLERYSVELLQENQVNYLEFFLNNLDKAAPFFFTFLIWVPFTVIGLLLVKLIYRKHKSEKQVFKVTLIAHCVKIGLFVVLCGGSVIIKLISPTLNLSIVNEIIISQVNAGHYRGNWADGLVDICFAITLLVGMLYIYRTQIRHGIIKILGGKAS